MEKDDIKLVEELKKAKELLFAEIGKVIIGQKPVVEEMLICLFSKGNCLLEGVPGLAKTLLVRTIARVLNLKFKRIQFTPDLMPSDITGTDIIEEDKTSGKRIFRFVQGPIFANIVLADEINRTPPKTQAALLEAMQEHMVTAAGNTYKLEEPFFVLATQNPIEQEGTYPLPEAQLDRFMFNIFIGYPTEEEEREIIKTTTTGEIENVKMIFNGEEILKLQQAVRKIPVSDHIVNYGMSIARRTRPKEPEALDFIKRWVSWGAGPRAAQYLIIGAKAHALLNGSYNVSCEDIRAVALPVLRHRIITNFNAEAEGVSSAVIIKKLLEAIPEPSYK